MKVIEIKKFGGPEVLEIKDPPTIVSSKKYRLKLLSVSKRVIPELVRLLRTPIIISSPSKLLK